MGADRQRERETEREREREKEKVRETERGPERIPKEGGRDRRQGVGEKGREKETEREQFKRESLALMSVEWACPGRVVWVCVCMQACVYCVCVQVW